MTRPPSPLELFVTGAVLIVELIFGAVYLCFALPVFVTGAYFDGLKFREHTLENDAKPPRPKELPIDFGAVMRAKAATPLHGVPNSKSSRWDA